jgi:hypothetical protein
LSISVPKSNLKALLREYGFSSLKAELWAEFVRQVLTIYWQAADQLVLPHNWDTFKNKAGALSVPKKKGKEAGAIRIPLEDAITSEIGHLADELRCNLVADHFLRRHDVHFRFESMIRSNTRTGKHSKIVDFEAKSAYPKAPHIAIEAKPLTAANDVANRYLGPEGMGCFFAKDSPYTNGPVGAMLAYTICGDNGSMQDTVLAALESYKPTAQSIKRVSVIGDDSIDCSHHERSAFGLEPITILHLERIFPFDVYPMVDDLSVLESSTRLPSTKKQSGRVGAGKKKKG